MISPETIREYLDKYAVGQDKAKEVIANIMFIHACRISYMLENKELPSDKAHIKVSNLLITGPSGSGKTFLIEKACECLDLPVLKINAKSLSNTGYVGQSLEDFFVTYQEKYGSHPLVNYGIIFIDEFDKLCTKEGKSDSWNRQLQYSLLKVVEGTSVDYETNKGRKVKLDTHNMLFVFAGNFEWMRERRNTQDKNPMGFGGEKTSSEVPFQQELIENGVVREIMGRISSVVEIEDLSKKDYLNILNVSEDSIYSSYKKLLSFLGIKRNKLTKKRLDKVASDCAELGIGARGLLALLDDAYSDKIAAASLEHSPSELLAGKNCPLALADDRDCPILVLTRIGDK